MPQTTTARSLLGSTTQGSAGSGTGASLDLGATEPRDTTLRLDLSVTAISGTGAALVVTVETSTDGTFWRALKSFSPVAAVSKLEAKVFAPVDRYVRAKWTLTGTTPSATFSVAGVSLRPIAHLGDFARLCKLKSRLSDATDEDKETALASAEEFATNELVAAKFVAPFVSWDDSLRNDIVKIAQWEIISSKGFNPEAGADAVFRTNYEDARANLRRANYAKLVDATPTIEESEVYVYTDPPRGWNDLR